MIQQKVRFGSQQAALDRGSSGGAEVGCRYEDLWHPAEWHDFTSSSEACARWSQNAEWGALRGGSTIRQACCDDWAQKECQQTCCETCPYKDLWHPAEWHDFTSSGAACARWAQNDEWGALRGGSTICQACSEEWAQKECQQTCCQKCPECGREEPPPAPPQSAPEEPPAT